MHGGATIEALLADLNPEQRQAAQHGHDPLLIVAGAGTGKTTTLVHRVAWLIASGVDPSRILLLTFTRRAAAEMIRRADVALARLAAGGGAQRQRIADDETSPPVAAGGIITSSHVIPPAAAGGLESLTFNPRRVWGGTFHAIATRLLRRFGKAVGLPPGFTIHDRPDSEDLMNVVRTELELAKTDRRFPKKRTCMDIYSRCVNARQKLDVVLAGRFPWCAEWENELKRLFDGYVDHKEKAAALDYDDLLLFWHALLADPATGEKVRSLFDCVLVDEFQDTNSLQAEILRGLSPDGRGLTVVGDDAQSIYSFRAANVRNILDFPKQYPGATVVTLEQNYRSTQPILAATNEVISMAAERFTKNLWSRREQGGPPALVTCEDEDAQSDFTIRRILEHREAGIDLRRQAVLFRASHHSMLLEAELARRNIPFHKYGGLKFIETAHVKDLLAFLRLAENPRDLVAGSRLLALLPGIGPRKARQLMDMLLDAGGNFEPWRRWTPPTAAAKLWPQLVNLLESLVHSTAELPGQVHQVRAFYSPMLEELYDNPHPRARDLEQLEQIATRYRDRGRMLSDITLDPPASTQDLAGPPERDDDYLVLSTIHSAKGLEWDAVYVIHAADGNIPSDMATGSSDEVEEERRLFYVALTRAKNWLYVLCPLRYFHYPSRHHDAHGYAQLTRFLTPKAQKHFERSVGLGPDSDWCDDADAPSPHTTSQAVRHRTKKLWS